MYHSVKIHDLKLLVWRHDLELGFSWLHIYISNFERVVNTNTKCNIRPIWPCVSEILYGKRKSLKIEENKEFETDYVFHPNIFGLLDFLSGYWILQPGSPPGYWPKKLISTPDITFYYLRVYVVHDGVSFKDWTVEAHL